MEVRRAYCSAVDRNVPVILTKAAPMEGRLTVSHPAALSCLDYPTRCTGWCCPLHAADEARAAGETEPSRSARPGARPDPRPHRS